MRAIVIGAGPAGSVAALALRHAGWDVGLFEAYGAPDGLRQGAFLTVAANGLDALAAIGADGPVRELGFATGRIRFSTGSGREVGSLPLGPPPAVTRTLLRADLYAALIDLAVDRGAVVHFERRLVRAERTGDGVCATFADGTTASGDLLVGADGMRSTVRTLIDRAAPAPRPTGLANVGALTRTTLDVSAEAADGDYRMIWGRRCFFGYTVSPDGEVWWFANPPVNDKPLLELLAVDAGPAAAFVEQTTGEVLRGEQLELPRVRTWHRDRMVLVGDAAHAVSPATGQGVSLACEDGVLLARALCCHEDVAAALAAFTAQRRPRVERVVRMGARLGGAKMPGPLGRRVRDLVMPYALALGGSARALERQRWLYDHHIEPPAPQPV
jgi:2-polyprenyl-6-methoxyphenol hydroxylase-like FAD-dependent oxidoreductase